MKRIYRSVSQGIPRVVQSQLEHSYPYQRIVVAQIFVRQNFSRLVFYDLLLTEFQTITSLPD